MRKAAAFSAHSFLGGLNGLSLMVYALEMTESDNLRCKYDVVVEEDKCIKYGSGQIDVQKMATTKAVFG